MKHGKQKPKRERRPHVMFEPRNRRVTLWRSRSFLKKYRTAVIRGHERPKWYKTSFKNPSDRKDPIVLFDMFAQMFKLWFNHKIINTITSQSVRRGLFALTTISMVSLEFCSSYFISFYFFKRGTNRFCQDIKDMIGFAPGCYWRVCWRFLAPLFLMFIIVYGLMGYEPLTYENYVYPTWANALGWAIAGSSVLMIPTVAVYQIIITPGTIGQRFKVLTTPWRDHQTVLARSMSMNGIQTDPAQIRLATPQATESV